MLFNCYYDIAGVGCNFAFSSQRRFGNVNSAGVGTGDENLIRKQTPRNIAGVCFYIQPGCIAVVEIYISRASLGGEFFGGDNVAKRNVARCSA